MPRVLHAFLYGLRIGHFAQGDGGRIAFEYEDSWRRRAKRIELSVSLPKSRLIHQPPAPGNFLTAIELGRANTCVRDFADIDLLTGTQALQCGELRDALTRPQLSAGPR